MRIAVFALCLLYGAVALADEESLYPIWWSPELKLESLDQIDELLDKPFPESRRFEVSMTERDRQFTDERVDPSKPHLGFIPRPKELEPHTVLVTNCRDHMEWADRRYKPEDFDALPIFAYSSANCYALQALKSATPARTSYLHDFKFDDEAMALLPAVVGEYWFCGRLEAFVEDNRIGRPWNKFPYYDKGLDRPIYRLVVESVTAIVVEHLYMRDPEPKGVYARISITIMGRGDFDNDGYEDLLLRWQHDMDPFTGRLVISGLYLVSRRQEGAVLRATDLIGPPPTGHGLCGEREQIRESGRFE